MNSLPIHEKETFFDQSEVRGDEVTLLIHQSEEFDQQQVTTQQQAEEGREEPPKRKWSRWTWLVALTSITILFIIGGPRWVGSLQKNFHLEYELVGVGGFSDTDKMTATIQIRNVPRTWWPITIIVNDFNVAFKGDKFAECSVPPVIVDMYTPNSRVLDVIVHLTNPSILMDIIKGRLSSDNEKQNEMIEVKANVKAKLHYLLIPLPRIEFQELIQIPHLNLDDLMNMFRIDIPKANERDGITVIIEVLQASFSGLLQLVQTALFLSNEEGQTMARAEATPQQLDFQKGQRSQVTLSVKPIDNSALFDLVERGIEGQSVKVTVKFDSEHSDPVLEFLKDLEVTMPIRINSMQTIEEIQIIRKQTDWLPTGAAVLTNPFSAKLTLLSLMECKVYRSANQKLFATINEPNIDPPIVIPPNAEHYLVDQSMNGKFEGSMMDLMRTIRELFGTNGTSYMDVEGTVTFLLDQFHVVIRNNQRQIPIRMYYRQ